MLRLEAGDLLLVQQKVIVFMHDMQEVTCEWLCLHVEAPETIVAVPVANHIDDVAVNSWSEEAHGTSGEKGACGHILGFES